MIGIGLTGLASGLDTEGIISQLLAIERNPRVRMDLRESQIETRKTALGDVATRLKNLKTAAADLRSLTAWADTQTVETSDAARIGARRLSGAGPGGYAIDVTQLARAEQRTYSYTPSGSASSITIDGVQVDLAANATLDDAVAAINSKSGSPVYAVNVGGQLVLSGRQTGSAEGFTATGATISEDAAKAKPGLDAIYTVDGGPAQTAASNVVTAAIPGVELTFKSLGSASVTVGAPAPDRAAIKAKVKAFVEQYNSTVDFIRQKIEEERDPKATTASAASKGVLRGDSMLSGVLRELRTSLTEAFGGGAASADELSEIGITTGASTGGGTVSQSAIDGKLVLDEAKLDAKLDSNLLDVRRMLGAVSGVDGFAQRFEGIIDPYTKLDGQIDERLDAANSELARLKDAMDSLDERLELREKRLRAQFAALEGLLAQSQSQGQWLSGQLAALPRAGSR